mmetsp:Transcript_10491/g.48170  ORF Transcript_10491/g.48170 Transcript_10491/m.48170 type:complete len:268 (-) Transcript_10491:16-819(-)
MATTKWSGCSSGTRRPGKSRRSGLQQTRALLVTPTRQTTDPKRRRVVEPTLTAADSTRSTHRRRIRTPLRRTPRANPDFPDLYRARRLSRSWCCVRCCSWAGCPRYAGCRASSRSGALFARRRLRGGRRLRKPPRLSGRRRRRRLRGERRLPRRRWLVSSRVPPWSPRRRPRLRTTPRLPVSPSRGRITARCTGACWTSAARGPPPSCPDRAGAKKAKKAVKGTRNDKRRIQTSARCAPSSSRQSPRRLRLSSRAVVARTARVPPTG